MSLALTSYHFASKDNLISEALDLAAEETLRWLGQTTHELTDGGAVLTPELVAERLGDLTMGRLGDEQLAVVSVVELSLAAARRPALQKATADWNDAYHAIVVDLLDRLRRTRSEGCRRARGGDARGARVSPDRRIQPGLRTRGAPSGAPEIAGVAALSARTATANGWCQRTSAATRAAAVTGSASSRVAPSSSAIRRVAPLPAMAIGAAAL